MGGRAFDNVVPVPLETTEKILAWVITLITHEFDPYDADQLNEFYLGLTVPSDRAIGDRIRNLHELLVDNGLRTLGSTGKKHSSGDVDIAVSENNWDYPDLKDFLTERFGTDNVKANESLNQIYTRIHVPGSGWHQVDFMLGDVQLLEFTHWSPNQGTSLYSGSHRTELIKAVAKALSDWTWVLPDDHGYNPGEMIARVGYTLNHDKGLVHGARFAPARVDGKGYTKKMVPVTALNYEAFLEQYDYFLQNYTDDHITYCNDMEKLQAFRRHPDVIITKTSVDPEFISQQLFGIGVVPEALNSYEAVVVAIKQNPELVKHRDLIWKLFVERLVQIGQPIPALTLHDNTIYAAE